MKVTAKNLVKFSQALKSEEKPTLAQTVSLKW